MTVVSSSYSWKWETISLGHRLGPEILSRQLIAPLVIFTEFTLKATHPLSQVDDAAWTKVCLLIQHLPLALTWPLGLRLMRVKRHIVTTQGR